MPRFKLAPESRTDEVVAAILLARLADARSCIPGALAGDAPEQLHRFRTCVRRSRTLLREFKGIFPPGEAKRWRDELAWLQRLTNPLRDLDVLLAEIDTLASERPALSRDLRSTRALLSKKRTAERAKLRRALKSARTSKLLDQFEQRLQALPDSDAANRPMASLPIEKTAAQRIRRRYKKLVEIGGEIGDDAPDQALHEVRKRGKDLRYLLKDFGELYPSRQVKPLVKSQKSFHDQLGAHQDAVVQKELLRAAAAELAPLQSDPRPILAIGALLEQVSAEDAGFRDKFDDDFDKFASKKRRRAVAARIR